MALAVLAAAGGLAVWERWRRVDQVPEVRVVVEELIDDLRTGRQPRLLAASEPVLARTLSETLPAFLDAGDVEIDVRPGDLDIDADLPEQATHVATLRRGDAVLVRLRLAHAGPSGQIAIIGYWHPPES